MLGLLHDHRFLPLNFIRLDDSVFDVLHQVNEIIESNRVGSEVIEELTDFIRVTLEGAHDRFKVLCTNVTGLFFVKELEDVFQILHLVYGELLGSRLGLLLVD